jgi:hypothetical protein
MKRTKKDTALSRHRKWLADLLRTKVGLLLHLKLNNY